MGRRAQGKRADHLPGAGRRSPRRGAGVDAALARIAEIAIPDIADWASVFLLERDRSIRVLTIERRTEADVAAAKAFLTKRPPTLEDTTGLAQRSPAAR